MKKNVILMDAEKGSFAWTTIVVGGSESVKWLSAQCWESQTVLTFLFLIYFTCVESINRRQCNQDPIWQIPKHKANQS